LCRVSGQRDGEKKDARKEENNKLRQTKKDI
jgi:hypothetical protein